MTTNYLGVHKAYCWLWLTYSMVAYGSLQWRLRTLVCLSHTCRSIEGIMGWKLLGTQGTLGSWIPNMEWGEFCPLYSVQIIHQVAPHLMQPSLNYFSHFPGLCISVICLATAVLVTCGLCRRSWVGADDTCWQSVDGWVDGWNSA